jgi:hypothetical protein
MVRALLSSSMMLGVFAVYFATSLQQTIAVLNNVFYFRLWLSKGLPSRNKIEDDPCNTYRQLPLDASAATLRLLAVPQRLLNLSILLYLVGFSLYLLLRWKANEKESDDYRKIFVVYITVLSAAFIDYIITSGFILLDARKRYMDFGIGTLSFHKSRMQKKIESSLTELQHVLKSEGPRSTHQEEHDTLRNIIAELDGLVTSRRMRRRISRVPTDREPGPELNRAQ